MVLAYFIGRIVYFFLKIYRVTAIKACENKNRSEKVKIKDRALSYHMELGYFVPVFAATRHFMTHYILDDGEMVSHQSKTDILGLSEYLLSCLCSTFMLFNIMFNTCSQEGCLICRCFKKLKI